MANDSPILDYSPPQRKPIFRWHIMGPLLGLVLLAFLVAAIVPKSGSRPSTKKQETFASLRHIRFTLGVFQNDTGRFPTTAEGLEALVLQPTGISGWQGPYLEPPLLDSWGTPFSYACPSPARGRSFDLRSAGPDRTFGTPDDIDSEPPP